MSEMSCKVSVILPVYNAQDTIRDAVESILAQSHQDFELLIIDDGSKDSTVDILVSEFSSDKRIKLHSRENKGLAYTLNELIDMAECELIFRMDADDFSQEDRLKIQINFMENNPEVVMCGGQIDFMFADSTYPRSPFPTSHSDIVKGLLDYRFLICHPSVVFRKNAALKVGKYPLNYVGEDLEFFLKMSLVGKLANVTEKTLAYRIGLKSLSMSHSSNLYKNYYFSVVNYNARLKGRDVVNPECYDKKWNQLPFVRLSFFIRECSEVFYRKSIILKLSGSNNYVFPLLLASLLRPHIAIKRILRF